MQDDAAELLPEDKPTTLPIDTVNVRGANEQFAGLLSEAVLRFARILGRYIDVSSLDGITVDFDYPAALSSIDRGIAGTNPLTVSTEERDGVVGVAMSVPVVREGTLKAHVVVSGDLMSNLASEDDNAALVAVHMLAHELGHVETTATLSSAFPDILMKVRLTETIDILRDGFAQSMWSEYSASRLAAKLGASPLKSYLIIFNQSVTTAREQCSSAITQFLDDQDMDILASSITRTMGNLARFTSNLLGTLDAFDMDPDEVLGADFEDSWFEEDLARIHAALAGLWQARGAWQNFDEILSLADIVLDLCYAGGIDISSGGDRGLFIEVRLP
jgi:hypothetical protein